MQNALILAGGKSSRMGFDKSLLKYDNFATITHFLYYKLSKLFACVQVSAKEQKFTPPLPLLKDDFKDFAPIFVLANLDKFFTSSIFIIPADQPFINESTILALFEGSKSAQICIGSNKDQTHPLCGFFNPNIAKIAKEQIKKQNYAIKELLGACDTKIISFDESEQFINLNTTADISKANNALNMRLKY